MIPDDAAHRIVVEAITSNDHARLLVEIDLDTPTESQLRMLVRYLEGVKSQVPGVRFAGVFTMIPAPAEASP